MVKIFNIGLLIVSLLLIVSGIYYSPSYFSEVFYSNGESTSFGNVVLIIDVLLIIGGVLLFIFRKKISKYKKEVLLLVITIIIFLFVIEVALRGYFYYTAKQGKGSAYIDLISYQSLFESHPYLNYIPAKNYKSIDGLNVHNSLGFRGGEIELPKPDNVYRIVALGGSTTYTTRVKDWRNSYPAKLEQVLKETYGFENVEVINAGVMSYDSWESLINLQFRVLDLDPDLVIVYHGLNDVNSRIVNPDFYVGDNTGRRKQWETPRTPWFFKLGIFRLPFTVLTGKSLVPAMDQYNTAPTAAPGVISEEFNERLQTTPIDALEENKPIFYERNLRNMIAIANANGVDIMFSTFAFTSEYGDYISTAHYVQGINEHNKVMKKVASEEDIPLYDFSSEMPSGKKYWADGRHVNEKGALLKAELFGTFIEENNLIKSK